MGHGEQDGEPGSRTEGKRSFHATTLWKYLWIFIRLSALANQESSEVPRLIGRASPTISTNDNPYFLLLINLPKNCNLVNSILL